jgi:hypothetical protein
MPYTIGGDGLLDFSCCESDEEKKLQAWDYFCENLSDVEVIAWDGKLVRGFTEVSFKHIISGSSNKWDTAMGHDIDFVESRARCLPLIGKVIRGEIKSRCWRLFMRRGKKSGARKILTVIEVEHEYFVVVLAEVKERYAILTAFPANKEYYNQRIKGQGVNAGVWGEGK